MGRYRLLELVCLHLRLLVDLRDGDYLYGATFDLSRAMLDNLIAKAGRCSRQHNLITMHATYNQRRSGALLARIIGWEYNEPGRK